MTAGPYALTKPCPKCPFRSDIEPYLSGPARVREIEKSLDRSEFPCHETTGMKPGASPTSSSKHIHCAGALILLEKMGRSSQMMRIAERLGMYDARKLDMDAPVFNSFRAMADAQGRKR